jgi:hypothetical protein
MNEIRPDYFQLETPAEATLRAFVYDQSRQGLLGTIEVEDIPDFWEGEVEIARVELLDSVFGDFISLMARPAQDGGVRLRIVDDYCECFEYEYVLERDHFPDPLTAEEVLYVFRNSRPCASASFCIQEFRSDFYPDLDELADQLGIKLRWDEGPDAY